MSPEIFSAFFIGFFGSLHCIGMCGPIAIALPVSKGSNLTFISGRILYNIGRIVTYTMLGLVFGFFGSRIALAGAQQTLSVILGIIIIIAVLLPQKQKNYFIQHPLISKFISPIRKNIGILFKKNTLASQFLIGVLNGFLPCGLVYIALAAAIASGDAISGAAVMILFGFGTFPAMFLASVFGKFINLGIRIKLRKATPYLALLLAVIFILRGMNLGIPYISPKIASSSVSNEILCH